MLPGVILCDDAIVVEMKGGTVNYFKDIESEMLDPQKTLGFRFSPLI